jgi:hypothetical protein
MSKFQGIAFWAVSTQSQDWVERAYQSLMPISTEGIGDVKLRQGVIGSELVITFGGDCQYLVTISKEGNGRGLVRPSQTAGAFVVCLSALRKTVGDITIVDDEGETVPTIPRQSCPAYAGDWSLVETVAQALGILSGPRFLERYGALLNRIF